MDMKHRVTVGIMLLSGLQPEIQGVVADHLIGPTRCYRKLWSDDSLVNHIIAREYWKLLPQYEFPHREVDVLKIVTN